MKALHIRLEGFSASFRYPLIISGTQLSTPVPSYSNLLGMMSACAGMALRPEDTGRIGFEFRCKSHDLEIERKDRWEVAGNRLQPVSKKTVPRVLRRVTASMFEEMPQGVGWRQVYWEPQLDLFVQNVDLQGIFVNPSATPCFGRSQDIAWIICVREVELEPVEAGSIGPTLIPYPNQIFLAMLFACPTGFAIIERAACGNRDHSATTKLCCLLRKISAFISSGRTSFIRRTPTRLAMRSICING